ncbi:MAG: dethiobiotin synthase [Planctomycetaceae bacterium]|nr:dethiobiotin synthase [Planctomycetaceae bacterium]
MSCRGLFIAGTDTGVGKTQVACLIVRALRAAQFRVGAYKPVCSGAQSLPGRPPLWEDLSRLEAALGAPTELDRLCRQRFLAPLAPPLAARLEQTAVDVQAVDSGLIDWLDHAEVMIVEGAGGWLCPLTEYQTLADWVARWRFPVLVVARRTLGTINHTLLTIESIRRRGLQVVGVVLNQTDPGEDDLSVSTNCAEIEARSGAPVLGEVMFGATDELRREGQAVTMHWQSMMGRLTAPIRPG